MRIIALIVALSLIGCQTNIEPTKCTGCGGEVVVDGIYRMPKEGPWPTWEELKKKPDRDPDAYIVRCLTCKDGPVVFEDDKIKAIQKWNRMNASEIEVEDIE